jgi:hypothetical protein
MRFVALAFGVLAACAGPVFAQGLDAENLLVGIPDGFELGFEATSAEGVEIHEFVPTGETVEDWSAMVTIQIFRGLGDIPGDVLAINMAKGWKGACGEDAPVTKLTEGDVNGFPFVLWTFLCPLNPQSGKPETMYYKGITGSDAFYSVQYAFRQEHADELDSIALPYLVGASACDTRKPERPCPEGM